ILACRPERGNNMPTFRGAPWARTMLNGARLATAVAPSPTAAVRRVIRSELVLILRRMMMPSSRPNACWRHDADLVPAQQAGRIAAIILKTGAQPPRQCETDADPGRCGQPA